MSNEEIKEVQENVEKEEKCAGCCFCKATKKILTIAVGTFVGFYVAMSLFFALHKPPMPPQGHEMKRPHYGMEQNFERRGPQHDGQKMKGEKPFKQGEMPARPAQDAE